MLAGQVITGRKKLVKGTILIKKLENPISERQVVLLVCLFQVVEVHTQHQHGHLAGFFFSAIFLFSPHTPPRQGPVIFPRHFCVLIELQLLGF